MPNKPRTAHMAHLVSDKGGVSPLCAEKPRPIRMGCMSCETWTNTPEAVTCPKCLAKMNDKSVVAPLDMPATPPLAKR